MKFSTTSALALGIVSLLAACDSGINKNGTDTPTSPPATVFYQLTVTLDGSGSVASSPAGINCGIQCSKSYAAGTIVDLAPNANAGSHFESWGGDCGSSGGCRLVMSQNHNVRAHFAVSPISRYTLTVSSTGDGEGTVVSSPHGIDCGAQCSADYDQNTLVTLNAAADAASRFDGWNGDCSGTSACTLTMDRAHSASARFTALPPLPPTAVQRQWLFGDTHVHDDHSSDGSFPRQVLGQEQAGNMPVSDQINFAADSGLDFLPLTDHRTYDQHYDPLWESSRLLLMPGEEANGGPHAIVHGAIDTIVQGANPPGRPDFVNLQQSIWDAHAQAANWSTAHPDDGETDDDGKPNSRASAQGVDTVEVWNKASNPDKEINYAENRWNAGFRFGVVGACDDHFKELWILGGPGMPSTGVFAPRRSVRGIVQSLQAGNTIVRRNSGLLPVMRVMLEADMNGAGTFAAVGGDEITAAAGTRGKLRITVYNGFGTIVSLYRSPGRAAGAIKTFLPTSIATNETYLVDITASDQPTWYRVEARGPGLPAAIDTAALSDPLNNVPSTVPLLNELQAVTSPVFIAPRAIEATPEVALPADIGIDDGASLALGSAGSFAGFPALAVDSGISHLVAEAHASGSTAILYRRRNADGSWSAAVNLTSNTLQARFPKIAARGNSVWVAWQDGRGGEQPHRPAIYLRHSADGGKHWEPEIALRVVKGRAEHPDLALQANGAPIVVWQEISAGNPFDVMMQRVGGDAQPLNLSRDGKSFHAANAFDSRSALYPASVWPVVSVSSDGRAAVAWQDNRTDRDPLWTGGAGYGEGTDPDNWQIMLRTLAPSATTWSTPTSLGANDRADRHPALTFTTDGRLVAAWDSKTMSSSGVNLSIQSAQSLDNGSTWSTPAAVAENAAAMSQWPKLGLASNGRAQLVWYDSRAADWRWRVMTTAMGNDGAWSAGELIPSRGINTWPAISNGAIAFASTRNALRLQRDRTQQVFLLPSALSP
ncbi:MAG: CehA/McbA family metallohydrolase [Pseudomonadota bacterium]